MSLISNREIQERWPVLLGATIAMFSGATALPLATSGMFMGALEADFGWHRASMSLGPALFMTGIALTTPIVGILIERFDARRLIAMGMLAVAACFAGLSQINGEIRTYYLFYILMAVVGNLSGAAGLTAIITRTFEQARGRALGFSMAGAGLTTSVGGPVVFLLVQSIGWSATYLLVGLFVLLMTPLVWALLKSDKGRISSQALAQSPGLSFREGMRCPVYWWMMIAFFFISCGTTGLIVHFVPLLIDKGVSPGSAAAMASAIGLSTIVMRLVTGVLVDRWDARRVSALAMSLGAVCFFIFLIGGEDYALLGAIAVGITFGSETDLVGYMVSRYYGMKNYGRLFGIIYGVVLSGVVFSPLLYGISKDMLGSYDPMLALAVVLLLVSTLIFTLLPGLRSLEPAWR